MSMVHIETIFKCMNIEHTIYAKHIVCTRKVRNFPERVITYVGLVKQEIYLRNINGVY